VPATPASAPTGSSSRHPEYRPDIDGLRAVAVLAVIAYHAFPDWLGGGYVGVDVFFVISGFLISGIIVSGLEQGAFSFARFYIRRARRLLPALAIVLAACYAIGWREMLPQELRQLSREIAASVGFVANIVFWQDTSYFNADTIRRPLIHLWSLGVEEQFYAIWPLCLWLGWRFGRRTLPLTATIFALSFACNIVQTGSDPVGAFFSPATRLWELLAGALILLLAPRLSPRGRSGDLIALAGAALVAWSAAAFDSHTAFPGLAALLPVAGTCLLIVAGSARAWLNRRVLAHPFFVFVGLISYPLYLWHWPLLSFANIIGVGATTTPPAERAVLVGASLLLAWLTYRLAELPIRTGGRGGLKAACLGVAMLALGAVAYGTIRLDGIASRFDARTRALATYAYDYYGAGARFGRCWLPESAPYDGYAAECLGRRSASAAEGNRRRRAVLLWGDSHAGRFYPGLREAMSRDDDDNVDLLEFARNSCVPILEVGGEWCAANNAFVLDQIRRLEPQTVLLFAAWSEYWTAPNSRDIWQIFEETLDKVKAAGAAKIVVMGPAPRWNRPLPRLLVSFLQSHPRQAERPAYMSFGLSDKTRSYDRLLRAIAERHGATYVSLLDLMCNDADGCLTSVPGKEDELSTWDVGHFTDASAAWVAGKLLASGVLP